MTTDPPPPRRKWHLQRWLLLLATGLLAYGGWTQYSFRAALKEAEALGWTVSYTDPSEAIRKDWKAAFKKKTWLEGVTRVVIVRGESFVQHHRIFRQLDPKGLQIEFAAALHDLSGLRGMSRLEDLIIWDGVNLENVDELKGLTRLRRVDLTDCKGLLNVNGIRELSALEQLGLIRCKSLTSLDALRGLSALYSVAFNECTGIANVDALKGLSMLKYVRLGGCTTLADVDGLKDLRLLDEVSINGCTGLTPEAVASLKAALPNAKIEGP